MRIRWHGHSCFEIGLDNLTLVTDPHDGRSIGIAPPRVRADIVLVSHGHFDHSKTHIVSRSTTKEITGPGRWKVKGVDIRGFNTFHDRAGGQLRGENVVFLFEMAGLTFCHLGDLGHILTPEQVQAMGKVDFLFVPVGGTFTIDAREAWQVIDLIKPRVVIPMHYRIGGLSLSIEGIDPFLAERNGYVLTKVGNEIEFEPDDLLDILDLWIFTPE